MPPLHNAVFRFTIRDVRWFMVVIALAVGMCAAWQVDCRVLEFRLSQMQVRAMKAEETATFDRR